MPMVETSRTCQLKHTSYIIEYRQNPYDKTPLKVNYLLSSFYGEYCEKQLDKITFVRTWSLSNASRFADSLYWAQSPQTYRSYDLDLSTSRDVIGHAVTI